MATNRFKSDEPNKPAPIFLHTLADKMAFCDYQNFHFKWGKGERWHYVELPVENAPELMVILSGPLAEDVWKVFNGNPLDHKDWEEARLRGLERKCRWYIERGTKPAEQRRLS